MKVLPSKISILPTFQCYLEKLASLNASFPLFHTPFFSNWPQSSCVFVACEIIIYNGFQTLTLKLVTIYIRTTSLKLGLVNFNTCGSIYIYFSLSLYVISVCFLRPYSSFMYISAVKILYRKKENNTVPGQTF